MEGEKEELELDFLELTHEEGTGHEDYEEYEDGKFGMPVRNKASEEDADKNIVIKGRGKTRQKILDAMDYPMEKVALSKDCVKFDPDKIEYLWHYIRNNFAPFVRVAEVKNAEEMHQFILKGETKVGMGNAFLRWSRFLHLATLAAFPNIRQNRHLVYQTVLEEIVIPFYKAKKEDQAREMLNEERVAAIEKRVAKDYLPHQRKFLKANKKLFEAKLEE